MPTIAEMQTRTGLARLEAERLAAYLGSLSPEGWSHPTACDLWQVGDLVGHLVWIGEFYVTFITRALAGDVTPPPGSPKDERYAGLLPEDFYDLTAREVPGLPGESHPPHIYPPLRCPGPGAGIADSRRLREALLLPLRQSPRVDPGRPYSPGIGRPRLGYPVPYRTRNPIVPRKPARPPGTGGAAPPACRPVGPDIRQSGHPALPTLRRRQPRLRLHPDAGIHQHYRGQ